MYLSAACSGHIKCSLLHEPGVSFVSTSMNLPTKEDELIIQPGTKGGQSLTLHTGVRTALVPDVLRPPRQDAQYAAVASEFVPVVS